MNADNAESLQGPIDTHVRTLGRHNYDVHSVLGGKCNAHSRWTREHVLPQNTPRKRWRHHGAPSARLSNVQGPVDVTDAVCGQCSDCTDPSMPLMRCERLHGPLDATNAALWSNCMISEKLGELFKSNSTLQCQSQNHSQTPVCCRRRLLHAAFLTVDFGFDSQEWSCSE